MNEFETMPVRTLPGHRAAAMQQQLAAEVTRGHRPRKPLLIAAGVLGVMVAASAGGYAYVQNSAPVTDKSEASCYTVASLSAGSESFTGIAQATVVGSLRPAQVNDALGVCATLWRQGLLRTGPQGAAAGAGRAKPDQGGTHPVPPLVACVLPNGTAAIFPGTRATCAALGLPNAG
jgi:hypothetical protein